MPHDRADRGEYLSLDVGLSLLVPAQCAANTPNVARPRRYSYMQQRIRSLQHSSFDSRERGPRRSRRDDRRRLRSEGSGVLGQVHASGESFEIQRENVESPGRCELVHAAGPSWRVSRMLNTHKSVRFQARRDRSFARPTGGLICGYELIARQRLGCKIARPGTSAMDQRQNSRTGTNVFARSLQTGRRSLKAAAGTPYPPRRHSPPTGVPGWVPTSRVGRDAITQDPRLQGAKRSWRSRVFN